MKEMLDVFKDCANQLNETGLHLTNMRGDEPLKKSTFLQVLTRCGYKFAFGRAYEQMVEAQRLVSDNKTEEAYTCLISSINYLAATAMYLSQYGNGLIEKVQKLDSKKQLRSFLDLWLESLSYSNEAEMFLKSKDVDDLPFPEDCDGDKLYGTKRCLTCSCAVMCEARKMKEYFAKSRASEDNLMDSPDKGRGNTMEQ